MIWDDDFIFACSNPVVKALIAKRQGWLRVFGRGIAWKDITVVRPIFSERYGYVRFIQIGPWRIRWLKKR